MRPTRFCGYALVILVLTSLAFGLDLTGKWIGKTGDGHDVVITLKSDGPQVSGTLLGADGKTEYPLQDVKSDGENLAFVVDIQWQGSPLRILAKGKTAADQVQLHLETEDASWSSDATLSREAKVAGAK